MAYFEDIRDGIRTTLKGLSLTLRHIRQATHRRKPLGVEGKAYFEQTTGLVTVEYPHEKLPIPDNGRYRLHNEIEDCIVCDKCAKICPVDCITIDPIKATEEVGRASDGSPIRLYAAQFDIDMAKCCYCGLCTVVCPTECLTMEKTFDYSTYELAGLNYAFANLTPEQADEKRALYEQYVREKEAAKAAKPIAVPTTETAAKPAARPAFRPGMKPAAKSAVEDEAAQPAASAAPTYLDAAPVAETPNKPRPAFRPGMKPVAKPHTDAVAPVDVSANPETTPSPEPSAKPRPVFRPGMKPKPTAETTPEVPPAETTETPVVAPPPADEVPKAKPAFRPTMKPPAAKPLQAELSPEPDATPAEAEAIAMQGVAEQPGVTEPIEPASVALPEVSATGKPRPAFRPTMKPAGKKTSEEITPAAELPTESGPVEAVSAATEATPSSPKPAFRPTMKPKPQPEPVAEPISELPAPEPPTAAGPEEAISDGEAEMPPPPKPKPAFRPTMKPRQE